MIHISFIAIIKFRLFLFHSELYVSQIPKYKVVPTKNTKHDFLNVSIILKCSNCGMISKCRNLFQKSRHQITKDLGLCI